MMSSKSIVRKLSNSRLVVAMTLSACMGTAQAAECTLVPGDSVGMDFTQRVELLSNGQYEKLEKILATLHKNNLNSEGGDLLTLRTLVELETFSMGQEALVHMWVDQRPQSFFANLLAGSFYAQQASFARSDRPAAQVSRAQLGAMKQFNEKAMAYLETAMRLDPHSALPHSIAIGIAASQGQAAGQHAAQWLQVANQVDPKNLAARINAVHYLSPRWGGSFELLDQMVEQAKKTLSTQSAHYLNYNVVLGKASHQEVIEKNKEQAHAIYKQAQSMCENSTSARKGMIRTYLR